MTRFSHLEEGEQLGRPNPACCPFAGFALPTSNTVYTPNQFFDVCLPHHSRGVVRLVGYLVRKTLGWCDADGRPQQEVIAVSYSELEREAGVGHSMIRTVLDEAERGGFIRCTRKGTASSRSSSGGSAAYELSWDESGLYVKNPQLFRGFFAGEGNRTYIPNAFFDHVLRREPLAVIGVVGSIIRFSIGFTNKFGHRRQRVALSYRDIQRYAKISSPNVLSGAIRKALALNYIERVEAGYFDPNGGVLSRAAQYALKWAEHSPGSPSTPKSVAEERVRKEDTEKRSGTTPITVAGTHTEKRSGLQITVNKTPQTTAEALNILKAAGFDTRAAGAIAGRYPFERIERQVRWVNERSIKSNRLGLLRAAIEQDWSRPGVGAGRTTNQARLGRPNNGWQQPSGVSFEEAVRRADERMRHRES